MSIVGIDVSEAQGNINYPIVKSSGLVNFIFGKATEGNNYTDRQFKTNWANIKTYGFIRGAYHFARPDPQIDDPIQEADNFIKAVSPLDEADMVALDIEQSKLTGRDFSNWVLAWCNRIKEVMNIMPIIYTGKFFFEAHSVADTDIVQQLAKYPLWIAAYVKNVDNFIPQPWKSLGFKFWQSGGDIVAPGDTVLHIPGINGAVDKDIFNGSLDDLKTFARSLHVQPDPVVEAPITQPTIPPDPVAVNQPEPIVVPLTTTPTPSASTMNTIITLVVSLLKQYSGLINKVLGYLLKLIPRK